MLGKALQDHSPAMTGGLRGTTLQQHYKANALRPVAPAALNTSLPSWSASTNPLKRTASQANARESPFSSQEQGLKKKVMIDLTQQPTGSGRVGKLHDTVSFDENDFDDDADIDLDEDLSLQAGSQSSDTQSSRTLLPDSYQKLSATPLAPASSTPLPWSSSPLSHHQIPAPKAPASRVPSAYTGKRRTLPWVEEEKRQAARAKERVDNLCESLNEGYSTQDKERLTEKMERNKVREADEMYEDLAGDYQAGERKRSGGTSRHHRALTAKGIPDFVADKIAAAKKGKAEREAARTTHTPRDVETLCEDLTKKRVPDFVVEGVRKQSKTTESAGEAYTPLPNDKNSKSPFPWNKTASAVKEEQKKLRQGHRKLSKDVEGAGIAKSNSKKKKENVERVFLSDEQKSVLNLVAEQRKSVFFTGSAGTGKSVLLRETIRVLRAKYKREPDRVAVTASTGLAACNVGGVTLHSFAGIGLGKEAVPELVKKIKRNQKAKNRWMRTKVLVVDEISMVDGDLFDKLESIARAIRNNGRPFGGIQLVITGDFFQLPPVPDYGRVAKFSFDASTWNTSIEHTIGLSQVFRQKDPVFANMLNEMRLGRLTQKSIDAFQALNRPLGQLDDFEATELFPTRNEVEAANSARMRNLSGKEYEFKAEDGGMILDPVQRSKLLDNCMAPPSITLKKGAQVMLIKNIDDTLVNGSVGKVIAFMDEKTFDIYHEDEDEFQAVETMELDDEEMTKSRKKLKALINRDLAGDTSQKWPLVRFAIADGSSRDLLCQRESWKIELPNGEVQASRAQVPLILAWALSIHKAQGQTLDRVKVDLGKIFEKGQAYVALSRATCQEGLQITRFDPKKVMAHDRVRTFYDSLYSVNKASSSNVPNAAPSKGVAAVAYENDFLNAGFAPDEDDDAMQAMYGM